jgi:hypothetical protein
MHPSLLRSPSHARPLPPLVPHHVISHLPLCRSVFASRPPSTLLARKGSAHCGSSHFAVLPLLRALHVSASLSGPHPLNVSPYSDGAPQFWALPFASFKSHARAPCTQCRSVISSLSAHRQADLVDAAACPPAARGGGAKECRASAGVGGTARREELGAGAERIDEQRQPAARRAVCQCWFALVRTQESAGGQTGRQVGAAHRLAAGAAHAQHALCARHSLSASCRAPRQSPPPPSPSRSRGTPWRAVRARPPGAPRPRDAWPHAWRAPPRACAAVLRRPWRRQTPEALAAASLEAGSDQRGAA